MGLSSYPKGYTDSGGLHCYHDSSWGRDVKPFGGYVVFYYNGAVDYSAKRLKIVPDSTSEAETAVASKAAKAVTAGRMLYEDQGRVVSGATAMLGDNQASRDLIVKPGSSARTRYFERATMLVKQLFMVNIVDPWLISTDLMVADIFTKALSRDKFYLFRGYLLNLLNAPPHSAHGPP